MRRCSCEEDDQCRDQATSSVDKCATDCGYNLAPIGGDIKDMVDCFGKQGPAIQAEENCLKRKINYKCDNWSQPTFINEINFDNLEFSFNETENPKTGLFMKKIYDSLLVIFKFNFCIRLCYKNVTIECYNDKRCGHDWADHQTLINFTKECIGVYSFFHIEQMQACHCLLYKLHLTKLIGTCIFIGNPSLKPFI